MLVDSHCHLDFSDFSEGIPQLVENARLAGVTTLVTISTRVANYDVYRQIAEANKNVFFTVGTHPHQADSELEITAKDLIEKSQHEKCIGIGEVGLDYFYQKSSKEGQKHGFLTHLEAAQATGLPLIIHSRDAEEDTYEILSEAKRHKDFKAVMHCFTGSLELARQVLDLGLTISFSGVVTYKSAPHLRELASFIPKDRILVETDAPYLAPGKMRGKRNEPAFVVETAKVVAENAGISYEDFAKQTSDNFFNLFTKASR